MYFDKPGKENSEETLRLALDTARQRGIENIVIASSSGETAEFFKGVDDVNVTCVTLAYGSPIAGENQMKDEKRKELEKEGIKVLTATHTLSGAERCLSIKFGGISPVEVMANTLRIFGQGMKVAVEIATMAMDAGCIPYGKQVISIGGTSEGVDTAIIIRAEYSRSILDTKVDEIICKPILEK